jgi:hypothetical protein
MLRSGKRSGRNYPQAMSRAQTQSSFSMEKKFFRTGVVVSHGSRRVRFPGRASICDPCPKGPYLWLIPATPGPDQTVSCSAFEKKIWKRGKELPGGHKRGDQMFVA